MTSINNGKGNGATKAQSIVADVIRAHEGDDLVVKANMTNQTTDLLLRVVRLIMVRSGTTLGKFKQKHRVWFNNQKKHSSYSTLNSDKNGRLKTLTRQDSDDKKITWAETERLLAINGLTIENVAITYYDASTGQRVRVVSDSNFEAERKAYDEARRLPTIDEV